MRAARRSKKTARSEAAAATKRAMRAIKRTQVRGRAIAASHAKTSDRLAFVGIAFFDIGGAFTPAMYKENWPPMDGVEIVTAEGFFKTGLILAGLYGLFCTWSAAYYVAGD